MKTILCTLIAVTFLLAPAHAQYAASASGSTTAAAEINSKPTLQIAADPTALAALNGTQGRDFAWVTSTAKSYICTVTGTPCGTWTQIEYAMTFTTGLNRSGQAVTCVTANGSTLGCISAADWTTFNAKVTNPLTTAGDIFIGGTSGAPSRLAAGALDTMLRGNGTGVAPSYLALPSGGTNGCSGTTDKPLYNSSTHTWSCGVDQTGGGSGIAPYISGTFTAQTHATITAGTHGFSTKGLATMVYSPNGELLAPDGTNACVSPLTGNCPITVDPSTFQVDVYFAAATTFIVVINGGVGTAGTNGTNGSNGAAGAGYLATSATSLATAGSGSKVFTTQAGLAYTAGARARATSRGTSEYMEGVVASYSGTTLTVTMDRASGTSTHADWNINLAGDAGATGPPGTGSISSTTNILKGDGAGAGIDSGIAASDVERLSQNQTVAGNRTQTGAFDASGAASTSPHKTGLTSALPATCTVGQTYFSTDGVPGRKVSTCTATNTWTPIAYDQGTVAGKPATCTIGQVYFATDATAGQNLYFCTATNTWTQQLNSGGGNTAGSGIDITGGVVSFNPLDPAQFWIRDEFCGASTGATGGGGMLNWTDIGGSNANAMDPGVANHPCIFKLITGATSGNSASIGLSVDRTSAVVSTMPDMSSFAAWETRWIVKPSIATTVAYYIGFSTATSVANDPPTAGWWIKFDTATSDTNWIAQTRINATSGHTEVDLGVAVANTNWYTIRLRSTVTGTIAFSVATNGGAFSAEKTACASACDITTNLPTSLTSPFASVITRTTAAANLALDWFSLQATGLGR